MSYFINALPDGTVWAVIGVFLCLVVLLLFKSAAMQAQFKKGLIFLVIIGGISVGYFLLTGKYPTEIPTEINNYFNTPREPDKGTNRYSSDPEKRFGDQLSE